MITKEIFLKAREYALVEAKRTGFPSRVSFDLSINIGLELAEKLEADKDIVLLGVYLMSLKLGEAILQKRNSERASMSAVAAKAFLEEEGLDSHNVGKVIACILSHNGAEKYSSIEAEIVANSDFYRFIHPRGFFNSFLIANRIIGNDFDKCLDYVESKMEEKYQTISLEEVKVELEPYYQTFKKYIEVARGK